MDLRVEPFQDNFDELISECKLKRKKVKGILTSKISNSQMIELINTNKNQKTKFDKLSR